MLPSIRKHRHAGGMRPVGVAERATPGAGSGGVETPSSKTKAAPVTAAAAAAAAAGPRRAHAKKKRSGSGSPKRCSRLPAEKTNWAFELMKACMDGNAERVRSIVETGSVDVNAPFHSKLLAESAAGSSPSSSSSSSPLAIAAMNGDVNLFKTLLHLGANPSVEALQHIEDVCVAQARQSTGGHMNILQIIHGRRCITPHRGLVAERRVGKFRARLAPIGTERVQKIAVPSGADAGRMLRYFVLNRDYESAKRLLCTGIDANFSDADGVDAMTIAVYGSPNQPDMVMLLMSFGAKSRIITPTLQKRVNKLVREHRKVHQPQRRTKKTIDHGFVNRDNPFFVDPHNLQTGVHHTALTDSDSDGDHGSTTVNGSTSQATSSTTTLPQLFPSVKKKKKRTRRKPPGAAYATAVGADPYAVASLPSIPKTRVPRMEPTDLGVLSQRIEDWREAEASFKTKVVQNDVAAMVAKANEELRKRGKLPPTSASSTSPKKKKKKKKHKKKSSDDASATQVAAAESSDATTDVSARGADAVATTRGDSAGSAKERLWNAVLRPDSRNLLEESQETEKQRRKRLQRERRRQFLQEEAAKRLQHAHEAALAAKASFLKAQERRAAKKVPLQPAEFRGKSTTQSERRGGTLRGKQSQIRALGAAAAALGTGIDDISNGEKETGQEGGSRAKKRKKKRRKVNAARAQMRAVARLSKRSDELEEEKTRQKRSSPRSKKKTAFAVAVFAKNKTTATAAADDHGVAVMSPADIIDAGSTSLSECIRQLHKKPHLHWVMRRLHNNELYGSFVHWRSILPDSSRAVRTEQANTRSRSVRKVRQRRAAQWRRAVGQHLFRSQELATDAWKRAVGQHLFRSQELATDAWKRAVGQHLFRSQELATDAWKRAVGQHLFKAQSATTALTTVATAVPTSSPTASSSDSCHADRNDPASNWRQCVGQFLFPRKLKPHSKRGDAQQTFALAVSTLQMMARSLLAREAYAARVRVPPAIAIVQNHARAVLVRRQLAQRAGLTVIQSFARARAARVHMAATHVQSFLRAFRATRSFHAMKWVARVLQRRLRRVRERLAVQKQAAFEARTSVVIQSAARALLFRQAISARRSRWEQPVKAVQQVLKWSEHAAFDAARLFEHLSPVDHANWTVSVQRYMDSLREEVNPLRAKLRVVASRATQAYQALLHFDSFEPEPLRSGGDPDYAALWRVVGTSCIAVQQLGWEIESIVVRLTLRRFFVIGEVSALHARHLLYLKTYSMQLDDIAECDIPEMPYSELEDAADSMDQQVETLENYLDELEIRVDDPASEYSIYSIEELVDVFSDADAEMELLRSSKFEDFRRIYPHSRLEDVLQQVTDVLADNDETMMEATLLHIEEMSWMNMLNVLCTRIIQPTVLLIFYLQYVTQGLTGDHHAPSTPLASEFEAALTDLKTAFEELASRVHELWHGELGSHAEQFAESETLTVLVEQLQDASLAAFEATASLREDRYSPRRRASSNHHKPPWHFHLRIPQRHSPAFNVQNARPTPEALQKLKERQQIRAEPLDLALTLTEAVQKAVETAEDFLEDEDTDTLLDLQARAMFLESKGHSITLFIDRSQLSVLSTLARAALDGVVGSVGTDFVADKFGASIFGFETGNIEIAGWRPKGLFEIMKFKADTLALSAGAAFRSGLRIGDIICAVNGEAVSSVRQIDALTRPLASLARPNASRVSITVLRAQHDDHDLLHHRFVKKVAEQIRDEVAAAAAMQWHQAHANEVSAARLIQAAARGQLARRAAAQRRMFLQHEAAASASAVKLQSLQRGRTAREDVRSLLARFHRQARAAQPIQALFRGHLARRFVVERQHRLCQETAAVLFQTSARRFLARAYSDNLRNAKALMDNATAVDHAAVMVMQNAVRGMLARKRLVRHKAEVQRAKALVTLQSFARARATRERVLLLKTFETTKFVAQAISGSSFQFADAEGPNRRVSTAEDRARLLKRSRKRQQAVIADGTATTLQAQSAAGQKPEETPVADTQTAALSTVKGQQVRAAELLQRTQRGRAARVKIATDIIQALDEGRRAAAEVVANADEKKFVLEAHTSRLQMYIDYLQRRRPPAEIMDAARADCAERKHNPNDNGGDSGEEIKTLDQLLDASAMVVKLLLMKTRIFKAVERLKQAVERAEIDADVDRLEDEIEHALAQGVDANHDVMVDAEDLVDELDLEEQELEALGHVPDPASHFSSRNGDSNERGDSSGQPGDDADSNTDDNSDTSETEESESDSESDGDVSESGSSLSGGNPVQEDASLSGENAAVKDSKKEHEAIHAGDSESSTESHTSVVQCVDVVSAQGAEHVDESAKRVTDGDDAVAAPIADSLESKAGEQSTAVADTTVEASGKTVQDARTVAGQKDRELNGTSSDTTADDVAADAPTVSSTAGEAVTVTAVKEAAAETAAAAAARAENEERKAPDEAAPAAAAAAAVKEMPHKAAEAAAVAAVQKEAERKAVEEAVVAAAQREADRKAAEAAVAAAAQKEANRKAAEEAAAAAAQQEADRKATEAAAAAAAQKEADYKAAEEAAAAAAQKEAEEQRKLLQKQHEEDVALAEAVREFGSFDEASSSETALQAQSLAGLDRGQLLLHLGSVLRAAKLTRRPTLLARAIDALENCQSVAMDKVKVVVDAETLMDALEQDAEGSSDYETASEEDDFF